MTETTPTNVIILNRMYVGDYLGDNIGHEVINLMKPDKGNDYYIYINARGDIRDEFINNKWNAKNILLTRWCTQEYEDEKENTKKQSFLEVLAKINNDSPNDIIEPYTLKSTITQSQYLIRTILNKDYGKFNKKFGFNIPEIKENDNISNLLAIEKLYKIILDKLQEHYKEKNVPISVYRIDKMLNNRNERKTKESILKEKIRLENDDIDKTNRYKKIEDKKIVCSLSDVKGNEEYLRNKEEFYNKPLQKLKHILQVISLKDVTYGNKSLVRIFDKNARNERALYVTFKTNNIYQVKDGYHIYLAEDDSQIDDEFNKYINVNKNVSHKLNFASTSLRQYIESDKHCDVFNNIINKINGFKDLWSDFPPLNYNERKLLDEDNPHFIDTNPNKANFIDIIRKDYDELIYSNLLYHIFKSAPELLIEFINEHNKEGFIIPKDYNSYTVLREEGNIDLLIDIRDNNGKLYLIVIENKIKSGINGIRHNKEGAEVGNQLSKYIHYAHGYRVAKGSDKTKYEYKKFDDEELSIKPYDSADCKRLFFIFAPLYKNFNIETINEKMKSSHYEDKELTKDNYSLITYDKIYSFFNKKSEYKRTGCKKIQYYEEFLYAIKMHKNEVDNIQERQMFERFADRIKELTPEQNQGEE